jgi:hypothetical protein
LLRQCTSQFVWKSSAFYLRSKISWTSFAKVRQRSMPTSKPTKPKFWNKASTMTVPCWLLHWLLSRRNWSQKQLCWFNCSKIENFQKSLWATSSRRIACSILWQSPQAQQSSHFKSTRNSHSESCWKMMGSKSRSELPLTCLRIVI